MSTSPPTPPRKAVIIFDQNEDEKKRVPSDEIKLHPDDIYTKEETEEAVVTVGGLVRPPMNQDEFDKRFSYNQPNEEGELKRRIKKLLASYYEPFTSWTSFKYSLLSFFPILNWLPQYNWASDLFFDVLGGITVGVMHVPQSIAYAYLAQQEAVIGLYTSFFAPLFYMLFGTSRHNSIGSFAVVALMAGLTVERLTTSQLEEDVLPDGVPTPIEVAMTLTLTVGLVQMLMGFCRLSFLTAYLSDQVIGGFTTAASCHVFVSQLKDLFGLRRLPRRKGAFNLLLKLYDVGIRLPEARIASLLVSISTIVVLVIGKELINPFVMKKLKKNIPLPFELLVVIGMTAVSTVFELNENFGLPIVNHIPTGMPTPSLPRFSMIPWLIPDAIALSIVTVAIHISLAKMFAKKLNYEVDPGQELWALGFTSAASSFVPVYPMACSLGRTLVNVSAGTRTQLSSIFSSALIISVILYFGKWLEALPMAVLSSVVVVALSGMAKKFCDLKTLWPLSKIDFSIWVVSFVGTVCIDVTEGLAIAILYALFTTITREQWPRWHLLGNVSGTMDYRDSERYQDVYFFKGICMFRFDSPLLFTNVERFKKTVHKAYSEWERSHEFYILRKERSQLLLDPMLLGQEINQMSFVSSKATDDGENKDNFLLSRHFIIDCSGFTFVDYMGVSALKEVYTEMRKRGILVYFAASKAPVRDLFDQSGFYSFVAKENFYPTIRDAVAIARRRQLAKDQIQEAIYAPEHDRLSEILSSHPLH